MVRGRWKGPPEGASEGPVQAIRGRREMPVEGTWEGRSPGGGQQPLGVLGEGHQGCENYDLPIRGGVESTPLPPIISSPHGGN